LTASATSSPDGVPPSGLRTKLLPSLGILLVTGGLLLLAWFAYLWFNPAPAPYRYTLVEEGDSTGLSQLGLSAWPGLTVARYEVHAEGVDAPVALATTARRGTASPVLISWENRTSELLLSLDSKLSELTALASAINKHAPGDARILAWWDISRQISLLAERDTLFNARLGEPLIIPSPWQARSESIRRYEDQFWGSAASADQQRKFQRFADALVAAPEQGAAILRELAGIQDTADSPQAFVVIHVTDLYKLGLMRPDHLDMAYKSFPMEGNMHGMIGYLKKWMQDNNFATYTLQSLSDSMVRGYFLRDADSSNTLIAQMLPFTTTQPLDFKALHLIYQQGGYWVYQIPPYPGAAPAEAPVPAHETAPIPSGG